MVRDGGSAVVDDVRVGVAVPVADAHAQAAGLGGEASHFRVFLNVHDVAEIRSEKKLLNSI